jgi:type IV pilus assembly protein PilW
MNAHLSQTRRHVRGFSLIEMMVAITVGLVLISVMSVVYLNSKSSTRRQDQLSNIQQSVRTAFEYLAFDSRMVGHLGCFTRLDNLTPVGALNLANNFAVGIEGYEYAGTAVGGTFAMTSSTPTDTTTATAWSNSPGATTATIPLTAVSGGAAVGITPGSDVLIVRSTAVGRPVRLTAAVAGGSATAIPIENRSTGSCPNGAANVSGFCDGSFGVISTCNAAQAFQVTTAGASLVLPSAIQGSTIYAVNATEVFPMQTVVYYIKRSSSGTTTSLYRRVLDGAQTDPALQDQELIEGVENMQIRYGVDTDTELDGIINGDYVPASSVAEWNRVVAVRISLLVRASTPIDNNLASTSAPVNGVTVTFPTTGPRFDRRVFTTTVALRNRIAYAAP